jgi:hypothetical protein
MTTSTPAPADPGTEDVRITPALLSRREARAGWRRAG